ncbi:MAG: aminotransferase class I/II-fold pyridoxal phosphate-dependent enzyme [Brevinematales bacterium]|nr:aminotransferase class I/II-fold pyridoxal phosphate-dependent enzyme [Brevinematales bacterium]
MDSERLRKLVRPEVQALEPYVAGKVPPLCHGKTLKLASNENLAIDNQDVNRYLRKVLHHSLVYYPDAHHTKLKKALSTFLKESGFEVSSEHIVFGDGSGESLQIIMMACLSPGERVIIPENSFSLYKTRALLAGAKVVEVPRKDFWVDLAALEEVVCQSKAKLVVFANPDNPTSTTYSLAAIEGFLSRLPQDTLVLLDEAYIHFAEWKESALSLLSRYPNLIVMHTLSKAFGLAALRVGYTISHPEMAVQMEKIRLPFNLGLLPQEGAWYRLTHPSPVWKSVSVIQKEREKLFTFLHQEGLSPLPAGGNFVFCDFGEAYQQLIKGLESHGITVRSLGSFGFHPRFVRITVGSSQDMAYFRQVFLSVRREVRR